MTTTAAPLSEKISRLSHAAETAEPISVLLIEDSKTVRLQLRNHIALLDNVTLFEAATLADARKILDQRSTSLFCAIVDLTLPDSSGIETVEAVRAYHVPIIVLTGSVDPVLRQAVLDLRVIDYMFKNGAAAIEDVAYLIGRLRQNQTMTVMIVDDSRTFRQHTVGLLTQYRFPILVAGDGQEALQLLDAHPEIALILTDFHMPGMNGLELVRTIRTRYRREDLAIIAISDSARQDLSAAMLKAGANDFLNKNFATEEFYCRVVQNTNMVHYVRELRDMANRDYLTHLYNRRYLFMVADTLYAEAAQNAQCLAVAMLDIDHFKRINDTYGHPAGDEALKRIAGVLRHACRPPGIGARYGGEEFVCVTQLADPALATEWFEALRAAIEAIDMSWNNEPIHLTASIGVTTSLVGSFTDMIELADQAVYTAKAEGRNRVVRLSIGIGS